MKILAKTFHFDKGQLQVILLPENFNEKLYSGDQWKENQAWHQWKDDIAYARAHPIDVDEKDKNKILTMIYANEYHSGRTSEQIVDYWNNHKQDLTEYNLEGVRMEIKEVKKPLTWNDFGGVDRYELKQVACLIEDDKQ